MNLDKTNYKRLLRHPSESMLIKMIPAIYPMEKYVYIEIKNY